MNIIPDWRRVIAYSLSFWMQIAGLVVLIVPEFRFALTGIDTDPQFNWWLGVLLLLAGIIGRLLPQGLAGIRECIRVSAVALVLFLLALALTSGAWAMSDNKFDDEAVVVVPQAPATSEAATLRIAVPFIAKEEGKRNEAYLDVVGVATICYGSTRGIRLGMSKSDAECIELLRAEVAEYRHGMHRYFTDATKRSRLPPKRDTAYTSLAFNAGIGAIGKSTATRRLNAGDIAGGCEALTWWNKAGGRVIRGLVNRRKREHGLCMDGLR
ncbi:MAG: lysozyme [Roseibium sp.]|nr:lysozyme [Roseibium sp.]